MKRRGFTLVELLVVITIIALLTALAVRVSFSLLVMAREASTKTTVQKISRALAARQEAWYRLYGGNDKWTKSRIKSTREWTETASFRNADNSLVRDDQRFVLARELSFARHFPQTVDELKGPPWFLDTNKIPNLDQYDNAAVLYWLLTSAHNIGEGTPTELAQTFSANEISATDPPRFLDAWGRPISFWRNATGIYRAQVDNSEPAPVAVPHQVYAESILPQINRPALKAAWGTGADDLARNPFDTLRLLDGIPGFEQAFHHQATYYIPLVMSAGSDGEFGIAIPGTSGGQTGELTTPWQILDRDPGRNILLNIDARVAPIADNVASTRNPVGAK